MKKKLLVIALVTTSFFIGRYSVEPQEKFFSVICQQNTDGVAMCENRETKEDYDFVRKGFGF